METPSLRQLFEDALGLDADARAAFLAEHCADADLRARLERMLSADTDPDGLVLAGGADAAARAIGETALAHALPPGSRVGAFELANVIGEGGSSTVFRTTRAFDGGRQTVALKLLRRSLYSPDARRQFRREQFALAQLRHGGIARLIEGGVTDAGLAYIALEFVDGVPITDYARAQRLDLRHRLALFMQVCRAVEAAHRALIVHRDLKPSNVMVDGEGQVKLLDFGIAKLLDADDETQTRMPAFTPAYAAPEQRSGGLVTTATDVYALGVLLGELVTGERLNDGSGRTPSAQVGAQTAPGVLPASARTTRRQLRGDLDNIVLKAIDTEPERRYASAGALAEDIERLLDGRPVAAHPPSAWYRTRRFVARHKGGVATTMAFLLAILAALAIALWQAGVARRQAALARAQAQRAEAVRDLLVGIFDTQRPARPREEMPGTAELLERGAARARTELAATPALQSDLLTALGKVYNALARHDQSIVLLDEAIAAARRADPADPAVLAAALCERAVAESARGGYAQALALFDEAAALQAKDDTPGLALAYTLSRRAVAESQSGRHDRAIADQQASLAIDARLLAADDPRVLENYNALGLAYTRAGRAGDGAPLLQKAADLARRRFGEAHVKTALFTMNYAYNQEAQHRYAEAVALTEKVVAVERTLYPADSPDRAHALANLGGDYVALGRLHDAKKVLDEADALNRGADLGQSMAQVFVLGNLAFADHLLGDDGAALARFRDAEAIAREKVGADHAATQAIGLQRARLEFAATPAAAALVEIAERIVQHPANGRPRSNGEIAARTVLGIAQATEGRAEAEGTLKLALSEMPRDRVDPILLPSVIALAGWQRTHGADAEADALLRDVLDRAGKDLAPTHYAIGELHLMLGELRAQQGRFADAGTEADAADRGFAEFAATHPLRQRLAALRRLLDAVKAQPAGIRRT